MSHCSVAALPRLNPPGTRCGNLYGSPRSLSLGREVQVNAAYAAGSARCRSHHTAARVINSSRQVTRRRLVRPIFSAAAPLSGTLCR